MNRLSGYSIVGKGTLNSEIWFGYVVFVEGTLIKEMSIHISPFASHGFVSGLLRVNGEIEANIRWRS